MMKHNRTDTVAFGPVITDSDSRPDAVQPPALPIPRPRKMSYLLVLRGPHPGLYYDLWYDFQIYLLLINTDVNLPSPKVRAYIRHLQGLRSIYHCPRNYEEGKHILELAERAGLVLETMEVLEQGVW